MSTVETRARRVRVAVGLLVLALLVAGGALAYHKHVRERWTATVRELEVRNASAVETFCAADAELATDPVFQPFTRRKDAAGFLNPLLGFSTSVDGGVPVPPGTLTVPAAVFATLRAANFMEVETADGGVDDAIAALDTAMLSRVHEFDHWELTGAGSPLTPAATWTAHTAPQPNFASLDVASKVHLAKAARAGTLPQAAKDVRQLARLCLSTEFLSGALSGLRLLRHERSAWEWAVARGVDVGDWKPPDAGRLTRAKLVFQLATVFFGLGSNEATFRRALDCAAVTRCEGLSDAVSYSAGLLPLLPEPAASRIRAAMGLVSTPDWGCSFATARYFAGQRSVSTLPEMLDVPTFLPHDDVGRLTLLSLWSLSGTRASPLEQLADAGVPLVLGAP